MSQNPIFKGTLTHPSTTYVGLPVGMSSLMSIFVAWKDGTSSATITLQTTEMNPDEAPTETAGTWQWAAESGVTITGPSASAAGSSMTHVGNIGASRGRLKIVTAATCDLEIRATGKNR